MIYRTLSSHLKRLAGPFPVIFLTGPRQSGKTTLARSTFPDFPYFSLEDLSTREMAREDPRGFIGRFRGMNGAIIDEAQHAPDLFSWLQSFVDDRQSGPIILTGSQHFLLADKISQSLAGRAAVLSLLPFSLSELSGHHALSPEDLLARRQLRGTTSERSSLDELLLRGLFPPIHDRGADAGVWFDSYIATYIERDVRTLSNVGDLDTFLRFVRLCAGRSGQLLNMSALGSDAGVDQTTARRWLSILRASYVVDLLQPHHANYRKRLVKTPKLYFTDTGLLCSLIGIRSAAQLSCHPLRGAIFENLVYLEFKKAFLHAAEPASLFFWRDALGREVDLLMERAGKVLPIEIKSGGTIGSDFLNGLDYYCSLSGTSGGLLVYGGNETRDHRSHLICSYETCCSGASI